jgi:hypothetical protein
VEGNPRPSTSASLHLRWDAVLQKRVARCFATCPAVLFIFPPFAKIASLSALFFCMPFHPYGNTRKGTRVGPCWLRYVSLL